MSALRSLSHAEIDSVCGAENGCWDPNPGPKTLDDIIRDALNPPTIGDLFNPS